MNRPEASAAAAGARPLQMVVQQLPLFVGEGRTVCVHSAAGPRLGVLVGVEALDPPAANNGYVLYLRGEPTPVRATAGTLVDVYDA